MYSLKDHYSEIAGRRLKVIFKDGDVLKGEFLGIYSGLETETGQMLLEIDTGEADVIRGAYEDEIEDIEVLTENHGEGL